MDNHEMTVRRSKIYTYFYGKRTIFQQFLIIVGVLFIMLAGVATSANYTSRESKIEKLSNKSSEARDAYYEMYYEYHNIFDIYESEKADPDNLDYYYVSRYEEKKVDWEKVAKEYNKTLDEYNEANEKLNEFRNKDSSDSFWVGFCNVIGYASIIVALIWMLIRKLAFNKDGEAEYDLELADILARAKERALEKLNIVAEQVDMVDPVVLNGIADSNGKSASAIKKNIFGTFFSKIGKFILNFGFIILGIIAAAILSAIVGLIAKNNVVFVIMLILVLALVGFIGKLVYTKYEKESFISPKTIKNLAKFYPNAMTKLGSDEKVRVSLPTATVYMFSGDQLYVYTQYIDIVTGKIFYEGIREFFYEDVVGVTSGQEVKKVFKRYGFFGLLLKSIDYIVEDITVVTKGGTYDEAYITEVGNSLLDVQFMGMRNLIRQKKNDK